MEYFVVGADGKDYGPASVDTLRQWAQENRLTQQSMLKDFQTGMLTPAGNVPGLFQQEMAAPPPTHSQVWAQPPTPSPYPRTYATQVDDGKGDIIGAIWRSALAVFLFFVAHGIGLIVGAYALFFAIRAQQKGHKHGITAIVIASVAMLAIIIGWVIRLSSGGSAF